MCRAVTDRTRQTQRQVGEDESEMSDLRGGVRAEMRVEAPREIIERARKDRAVFGELYDHYLPRVYAFCRIYSGTREEAEDLTAQTFERALVAIGRYEDRGAPFSSWLLRIAANAATDRARKQGRAVVPHEDARGYEEGRLREFEEAFWLRGHLATLPADQQEVVRLRFYEDRSFLDVAARMGRSEGAVKQLLRRALKSLNARIQEEAADV